MEYISKNNAKAFKSKTTTQREYYTPSKRPNFSMILPKSSNFWVYFPDSNIDQDNYDDEIENEENSKKIKLKKSTVKKIFDMQGIPFKNIIPYIEFSFSYVKSETVTNTITTFNIEYKTIMKIIDNFYIQFGNEEDIEINKKSLNKIFNLIGLPINQRLNLMQFYEVDEDVIYEEEEEEDQIEKNTSIKKYSTNKNNNTYNRTTVTNTKTTISMEGDSSEMKYSYKNSKSPNYYTSNNKHKMKNKIKIVNTGTTPYTSDRLDKSHMEKLFALTNNMPEVFKLIKKSKKDKKKGTKKLLVEGNIKKYNGQNINSTVLTLKSLEERVLIAERPIYKYHSKVKPQKKDEPHQKKTVAMRVKSRSVKRVPNVCVYPFILRKKKEYEDATMYLTGSLPQLGKFNPKNAIPMDEEDRNGIIFYTKYIDIRREDFPFEYKYFYIKDKEIKWVGMPFNNYKTHPQFFKLFHGMKKSIISILDLNIRYYNDIDGLNVWDQRKEAFIQCLLNSYADVFFFQEITHIQYDYIDENLNSVYEFVGIYRDSTDRSEKCSISYNIFKYTLIDWGQFWLSSTPYTPGSNDFKNFFPRICTWAALKQINGLELIFFNIHLDHVNFDAHLPCINVFLEESEKILDRFPQIRYVFLGGCLYCEEDDPVVDRIKSYSYEEVMIENTFHDFTGEADRHWDYLFWKERGLERTIVLKRAFVLKKEGTINEEKQQYISDHYPYYAEFQQTEKTNNIRVVN
jgi:endonuclease/exonuclease/phosphatase family metal-dependent hydrolase